MSYGLDSVHYHKTVKLTVLCFSKISALQNSELIYRGYGLSACEYFNNDDSRYINTKNGI